MKTLVPARVLGTLCDHPVVDGEVTKGLGPEGVVVAMGEKFGSGLGRNPGTVAEFSLKLAFRPAGVADKRAHQGAGILNVLDGIVG